MGGRSRDFCAVSFAVPPRQDPYVDAHGRASDGGGTRRNNEAPSDQKRVAFDSSFSLKLPESSVSLGRGYSL